MRLDIKSIVVYYYIINVSKYYAFSITYIMFNKIIPIKLN